uniref:TIL domain-containing protein n=1 Tax=Panagrellus redivivus TaxID=6233 RepID=A0A7E4UZA6_PANRE
MSTLNTIFVILFMATTVSMLCPPHPPPICSKNEDMVFCSNDPTCESPSPQKGGYCGCIPVCICKPNLYRHNGECIPASECAIVVKDFDKRLSG